MVLPWRRVPLIHNLLKILDSFYFPLVSPYGSTLEVCELDTEIGVDPRYILLSPSLSL